VLRIIRQRKSKNEKEYFRHIPNGLEIGSQLELCRTRRNVRCGIAEAQPGGAKVVLLG
jgi:hypothetical protein